MLPRQRGVDSPVVRKEGYVFLVVNVRTRCLRVGDLAEGVLTEVEDEVTEI